MFLRQRTFLATYVQWLLLSAFSGQVYGYLITNVTTGLANETFDYVVVGGGTAGLTIANRLTEDSRVTVLVIEAGKDEKNNTAVTDPENFTLNLGDLSWGYVTTNQSFNGKAVPLTVGRSLGGSSSVNGMQWTRGTVGQYDAIEALGSPGWNFASLQHYMKKAEAFRTPTKDQLAAGVRFLPSAHGTSGPVIAGFPNPYPCPVCTVWDVLINSTVNVFPDLRDGDVDHCSGDPRGIARSEYSIIPGSDDGTVKNRRSSSAQSYVYSLATTDRPNMQMLVQHHAARIVWGRRDAGSVPKPAGVEIIPVSSSDTSGPITVKVRKEVIVTSGAIGTPKFLELSGIGNRTLLEGLGIPVIVDLPAVGTNLQDQASSVVAYNTTGSSNTSAPNAPPSGTAAFFTLSQILGSKVAKEYVQNLKATLAQRAEQIFASGECVSRKGVQKMLEAQLQQIGEQEAPVVEMAYGVNIPGEKVIVGATWNLIPQYRGSVHIASADPMTPPKINPNYLSAESDFFLLVNATISMRRIFISPPANSLSSAEFLPGSNVQTDDQFRSYVKESFGAVGHPLGTASLLPRELGGVVDENLRVYGVQGLRVADASILPLQISAHTSSTVYGIAEKAADLIKGVQQP